MMGNADKVRGLLFADEAARRLGLKRHQLTRWTRQGKVPGSVKVGSLWGFAPAAIKQIVEGTLNIEPGAQAAYMKARLDLAGEPFGVAAPELVEADLAACGAVTCGGWTWDVFVCQPGGWRVWRLAGGYGNSDFRFVEMPGEGGEGPRLVMDLGVRNIGREVSWFRQTEPTHGWPDTLEGAAALLSDWLGVNPSGEAE